MSPATPPKTSVEGPIARVGPSTHTLCCLTLLPMFPALEAVGGSTHKNPAPPGALRALGLCSHLLCPRMRVVGRALMGVHLQARGPHLV